VAIVDCFFVNARQVLSFVSDKNEESNLFAMVARDTPGFASFVDYHVATSEIEKQNGMLLLPERDGREYQDR